MPLGSGEKQGQPPGSAWPGRRGVSPTGTLLARLAAGAAVTGDEELLLNARDRAAVGDKVVKAANALLTGQGRAAALTLAEGEGDVAGGFILRRGSIEVNCTAELLVELQRGEMAAELANVLFA